MTPAKTYDETRLPKWAQRLLDLERMRAKEALDRYEAQMDRLAGSKATDTIVGAGYGDKMSGMRDYPLKPGQDITFTIPGGNITVKVTGRTEGVPRLEIYAHEGRIEVRPYSANIVTVGLVDRFS